MIDSATIHNRIVTLTFQTNNKNFFIIDAIGLSYIYDPNFDDNQRKKFGFSLENTLEKCIFNKNPCTLSDFEW